MQPRRAVVLGTGGYLPERIVTNREVSEKAVRPEAWIVSRAGIHRRRFAADGEVPGDMSTLAARQALAKAAALNARAACAAFNRASAPVRW